MHEDIIKEINETWTQGHFDSDQRDYFIELLLDIKPEYCLETGFCTGTSSVTVCASCKPEKMISVSLASNNQLAADRLQSKYNFRLIQGDSTKILNDEFFITEFSEGIDFYFVDGGHTYREARYDLDIVNRYMNNSSVIIVDDYHSKICKIPDVERAVDDFVRINGLSLEKIATNSGKGMAKIHGWQGK